MLRVLIALLAAVLSVASSAQTASSQHVSDTPESAVRTYCQLDFDGARMRSQSYDVVSKLILWHTEPGWDRAYVVREFQIISVKKNGSRAAVTVEYRPVALIDGGVFTPTPRNERVTFRLTRSNKEWVWRNDEPVLERGKLAWRITHPVIPPHTSITYAIKHFESIIGTSPDDYDHQLTVTVQKLKEAQRRDRWR